MTLATDAIRPAIDLTSKLIFPFSWRKWLVLGVIAFFVGQGGFSVLNFNIGGAPSDIGLPDIGGLWPVIAAAVLLGLLVSVAFYYVKSVFQFVLFDCVMTGKVAVRRSFNAYHEQGVSRFWYGIVIGVCAIIAGVLPVLGGIMLWWAGQVAFAVPAIVFGGLVLIALALFDWFVRALVMPVMYFRKVRVRDALRLALERVRGRWGEVVLYFFVSLVLGIAAGMLVFVAVLLLGLCVVAVAALLFGVGWLLYQASAVLLVPLIGAGILLAVPLALAVLVGLLFVTVPFASFFAAYMLLVSKGLLLKK